MLLRLDPTDYDCQTCGKAGGSTTDTRIVKLTTKLTTVIDLNMCGDCRAEMHMLTNNFSLHKCTGRRT